MGGLFGNTKWAKRFLILTIENYDQGRLLFQYFTDNQFVKNKSKPRATIELLPTEPVKITNDGILAGCPAQSCLGMMGIKNTKAINFFFTPEAGTDKWDKAILDALKLWKFKSTSFEAQPQPQLRAMIGKVLETRRKTGPKNVAESSDYASESTDVWRPFAEAVLSSGVKPQDPVPAEDSASLSGSESSDC